MSKRIPLRRCSNGHRCWANLNLSSGIWQLRTWRMKSMTNWCRSTLPRRISRGTTSPQTCSSPSPEPGRQRAARWAPSLPRQSPTLFVRLVTSSSRNKKISTFTCRRMKMWNLSFVTFVRKHSSLKTNWGRVQPLHFQDKPLACHFVSDILNSLMLFKSTDKYTLLSSYFHCCVVCAFIQWALGMWSANLARQLFML